MISVDGQISRSEYEELVREVRELRRTVEELISTLKPVLYLVERLPELMTDPGVFKAAAPILSLPYALERVNLNVLGAAMVGGLECVGRALEDLASGEKPPEMSLLKILTDRETKQAIGTMIEILKKTMPCLHSSLRRNALP